MFVSDEQVDKLIKAYGQQDIKNQTYAESLVYNLAFNLQECRNARGTISNPTKRQRNLLVTAATYLKKLSFESRTTNNPDILKFECENLIDCFLRNIDSGEWSEIQEIFKIEKKD